MRGISKPTLILTFVVITGVFLILFGFFTERLFVIHIERESSNLKRIATDLLYLISSNSPYLISDGKGNVFPFMLDEDKIKNLDDLSCCDIYEYDYDISFVKGDEILSTKSNYQGSPFTLTSFCYLEHEMGKEERAELPVKICNSLYECEMGKVNISLKRTPLSELSYWIGKACMIPGTEKEIVIYEEDLPESGEYLKVVGDEIYITAGCRGTTDTITTKDCNNYVSINDRVGCDDDPCCEVVVTGEVCTGEVTGHCVWSCDETCCKKETVWEGNKPRIICSKKDCSSLSKDNCAYCGCSLEETWECIPKECSSLGVSTCESCEGCALGDTSIKKIPCNKNIDIIWVSGLTEEIGGEKCYWIKVNSTEDEVKIYAQKRG